jgi:S-adenosylmethionine:tRNA-ribosyltransferase-isomerase (queuine synthetase)
MASLRRQGRNAAHAGHRRLAGDLLRPLMRVSDFDFDLPQERIALRPASPRDSSKLLIVKPDGLEDRIFRELPQFLKKGDVLVFNNTRVIPAALSGHRIGRLGTTPKIEALLHMRLDGHRWRAFAKPGKKAAAGRSHPLWRGRKSLSSRYLGCNR